MQFHRITIKIFCALLLVYFLTSCNNAIESPYAPVIFEKLATIPGNGRSSAVAFAIDGKGYVALGRDSNKMALNDCWQYNPADNTWIQKNTFPGIPRVKAMAVVLNGKAYVGLGFDPHFSVYSNINAYLKDFWMYDPQNDSWVQKDSLPSHATDACVGFEFNNEIYVGSGFNGRGFSSEFWKYSPVSDKWTQLNHFPGSPRAGGVLCKNGNRVFFGSGYRTVNENDWWEYFPETDSWTKRKNFPDNGRINAISLSINNRCFISTGKHFGGNLTGGHVKSDIIEYDNVRNVWYERGNLPAEARENAISFTIEGRGYIGFGDNEKHVMNDLWSFEP